VCVCVCVCSVFVPCVQAHGLGVLADLAGLDGLRASVLECQEVALTALEALPTDANVQTQGMRFACCLWQQKRLRSPARRSLSLVEAALRWYVGKFFFAVIGGKPTRSGVCLGPPARHPHPHLCWAKAPGAPHRVLHRVFKVFRPKTQSHCC
jgi:hypothetical protein